MVEEGHPLAGGAGQGAVGRRRDVSALRTPDHADARVARFGLGQDLSYSRVARRIVGDAQLPVRIGLPLDRRDRLLQDRRRRVADRQHDGDGRVRWPSAGGIGKHCGIIAVIRRAPLLVPALTGSRPPEPRTSTDAQRKVGYVLAFGETGQRPGAAPS